MRTTLSGTPTGKSASISRVRWSVAFFWVVVLNDLLCDAVRVAARAVGVEVHGGVDSTQHAPWRALPTRSWLLMAMATPQLKPVERGVSRELEGTCASAFASQPCSLMTSQARRRRRSRNAAAFASGVTPVL